MDKVIFLVDMNAFFITCETLRHPELAGNPSAVAGSPEKRTGIILAANYEARACGVKTAMPVQEALRKCPTLILLPPDHAYYEQLSCQVMDYLSRYSPLLEQNSIDEAWLDMSGTEGLFGPPKEAAEKIQSGLRQELGLWCSIGIAPNKFLAKMASEMKKPLGITRLAVSDLPARLWPQPVGTMYGVGRKTTEELLKMNIRTIGDLAETPVERLLKKFGKAGYQMHQHARGIDPSPLTPHTADEVKSIGKSVTLAKDITALEEASAILTQLADEVSIRARHKQKKGHTVQITLKYHDFSLITRQCSISETNLAKRIRDAGLSLLEKNWDPKKPVRLLGISLGDFDPPVKGEQLSLFLTPDEEKAPTDVREQKEEKLQNTLDELHQKFGDQSVSWGSFRKPTK